MIELLALLLLALALYKKSDGLRLLCVFFFYYIHTSLYTYIDAPDFWLYYVLGAGIELACIKVLLFYFGDSLRYISFNIILMLGNFLGLYLWANYMSHIPYNIYFIVAYLGLLILELKDVGFYDRFRSVLFNFRFLGRWRT